MTDQTNIPADLKRRQYDQQLTVTHLQRQLYETPTASDPATRAALIAAQQELYATQRQIAAAKAQANIVAPDPSTPPSPSARVTRDGSRRYSGAESSATTRSDPTRTTRGLHTTGLQVDVNLQMEHLPTAIYHLFDAETHPLVECVVHTKDTELRRLRISAYIENYSAQAVVTLDDFNQEKSPKRLRLLPTLFSDRARTVHELTRATLNVCAEDLANRQIEIHKTKPIWLLARNAAPLAVKNPDTQRWDDLSRYYGAFVTPNQEEILSFVRTAAAHHLQRRFIGYQSGELVNPQVEALYNALQKETQITYINSTINFNPDAGARSQRVRLPRQTLTEKAANCIDGVLLFASLLEAISLNPAIVIIPGHALLGWETGYHSEQWQYLETTCLSDGKTFAEACASGNDWVAQYEPQQQVANAAGHPEDLWFRRWSLRDLRTTYSITPME